MDFLQARMYLAGCFKKCFSSHLIIVFVLEDADFVNPNYFYSVINPHMLSPQC